MMNIRENEFIWTEAYRPNKVSECILPGRLKKVFQAYVDQGNIPNLILTGSPGTGKTTIAMAMCDELKIRYLKLNSSDDRGIDTLRTDIKRYASTVSLTGTPKVIILDEADYLTPEMQAGLRGAIEEYSNNCTFIMTCNYKSKLIEALHSRTAVIDFKVLPNEKVEMQTQFFKRTQEILQSESVPFEKAVLAKIIDKYFPDYRRTLNELQRLASFGGINLDALSGVSDIRNLNELFTYLSDKDWNKVQKWVVDNSDVDHTTIFRVIYDNLRQKLKPSSIPQAVVILANYQDKAVRVADQEINLVACLTEIMIDCDFL